MKNKVNLSFVPPYQEQLFKELLKYKVNIEILDQTNVVMAIKNKKRLFFIDEYTPLIPHNIGLIFTNDILIDSILKYNNIHTSNYRIYDNYKALTNDCSKFLYPVTAGLRDVYSPLFNIQIKSDKDVKKLSNIFNKNIAVIIKQGTCWKYRLLIYYDDYDFLNILSSEFIGFEDIDNFHKIKDVTCKAHVFFRELAKSVLACFPGLKTISFVVNTNELYENVKDYSVETIYNTCGYHYQHYASKNDEKVKVRDLTIKYLLDELK